MEGKYRSSFWWLWCPLDNKKLEIFSEARRRKWAPDYDDNFILKTGFALWFAASALQSQALPSSYNYNLYSTSWLWISQAGICVKQLISWGEQNRQSPLLVPNCKRLVGVHCKMLVKLQSQNLSGRKLDVTNGNSIGQTQQWQEFEDWNHSLLSMTEIC